MLWYVALLYSLIDPGLLFFDTGIDAVVIFLVLGVDVMDVSGEHFHDVDHNIYKVRLDPNGEKVSEEKGRE